VPSLVLRPASKKNNQIKLTETQAIQLAMKKVVDRLMNQYDSLIKTTIRKNNDDIYRSLLEFLAPQKMGLHTEAPFNSKGLTI